MGTLRAVESHDLTRAGLVDCYVVVTVPLVLGAGLPLWPDGGGLDLTVEDAFVSGRGIVVATYVPRR